MEYEKVKSLEHLKTLTGKDGGADFVLQLNGGLRSSKHVSYEKDAKCFCVTNFIDDSEQQLDDKQIMDKEYTNIGEGIRKGAFYWEK